VSFAIWMTYCLL